MNYLLARVRGGRITSILSCFRLIRLFNKLTIGESLHYSPETRLEDKQWYRIDSFLKSIDSFLKSGFCIPLLTYPWHSTAFRQMDSIVLD